MSLSQNRDSNGSYWTEWFEIGTGATSTKTRVFDGVASHEFMVKAFDGVDGPFSGTATFDYPANP